jgi:hypothetical protein
MADLDRQEYFDNLLLADAKAVDLDRQVYGGVYIPKKEFIKEHKMLLKILKSGNRTKRLNEARKQEAELAKILS